MPNSLFHSTQRFILCCTVDIKAAKSQSFETCLHEWRIYFLSVTSRLHTIPCIHIWCTSCCCCFIICLELYLAFRFITQHHVVAATAAAFNLCAQFYFINTYHTYIHPHENMVWCFSSPPSLLPHLPLNASFDWTGVEEEANASDIYSVNVFEIWIKLLHNLWIICLH